MLSFFSWRDDKLKDGYKKFEKVEGMKKLIIFWLFFLEWMNIDVEQFSIGSFVIGTLVTEKPY